jgi:thymidylate synthase
MVAHFTADNTAELARKNLDYILSFGEPVIRRVGDWCMKKPQMILMKEQHHVILELTNPLNCVTSQHCLGAEVETEDYLLGLNPGYVHLSPWSFYKQWLIHGDYGSRYPYTYGQRGGRYLGALIGKIKNDPTSRHLVMPLFDLDDMNFRSYVPCTTQWAFDVVNGKLNMTTTMRSQDACRGVFLDTFAYPIIQQYVALNAGLKLGRYYHIILNSHVYGNDIQFAHDVHDNLESLGELKIDNITSKDMKDMQTISDMILARPSETNLKMASLLIERLPKFWMNWKKNQYVYSYTKNFSKQGYVTELTCKGALTNVMPRKL